MKNKVLPLFLCLALTLGLFGCAQKIELAGLALQETPLTLEVGSTQQVQLNYSFSKEMPTEEEVDELLQQITLVWQSSNTDVATVDEGGNVTAQSPGVADVTVSDEDEQYTATIAVRVIIALTGVTAPDEIELDILSGETADLGAKMQPENASGADLSYASSNEDVVTVDANGRLTPVAEGEATITVTANGEDLSGETEKTVETKVSVKLLPQEIALVADEGFLHLGYGHQLKPYTLPEEAPETEYTYKSSDENVATVDETGNIKAVGLGTCTITITSAEGLSKEFALTVTAVPAPAKTGKNTAGGKTGGTTGSNGGTASGGGTGGGSAGSGGTGGGETAGGGGETSGGSGETAGGGGETGGGNGGDGPYDGSWDRPGNPDGDGSPGNPIDSGSGGTPDDGQAGNGWE